MAQRRILLPWDRQPQEAVAVSPAGGYALAFLWNAANQSIDTVTGNLADTVNTTRVLLEDGVAQKSALNQTNVEWNRQFVTTSLGDGLGDFTVLIVSDPSATASSTQHMIVQKNDASAPYAQMELLANTDETGGSYAAGRVSFYTYNGAVTECGALGLADGGMHVWIGRRFGARHELYKNGALVATTINTVRGITQSSPMRRMAIGSRGNGSANGFDKNTLYAAGADIAWTPEQIAEFKTPNDVARLLFAPQQVWVPVAAATGGTYIPATVLPAGVAAIASIGTPTATGATQAMPAGVTVSASAGDPTATGAAKALPAGVSAVALAGTPTAITGVNIPATALLAGVTVTGSVGTATATGAANAQSTGVAAFSSVGQTIATGVARSYPAGVTASASVGVPTAITVAIGAIYPPVSQVLLGVQYGPSGFDFTGTLTGGGGVVVNDGIAVEVDSAPIDVTLSDTAAAVVEININSIIVEITE